LQRLGARASQGGFMYWIIWYLLLIGASLALAEPIVIPHGSLTGYGNNNNSLTGIATPSLGAVESEVWHSSIAVGSETPFHAHAAEEIVILLNGTLEATVENKSSSCAAPCTIILPAFKKHKLKNIGGVPTSHYLVMPSKSKIFDNNNEEMNLPWRK
jgi:quercetin dioxygenase-like cupin family protein